MSKEFEIVFEGEFPGSPEQVWQAVTSETAAWLFPDDEMAGENLVFEPPTHRINRIEGPDGWFNQLEQEIEERPGGRSFMRWVHSGVLQDDWDNQYDGARRHTDFYMHTLAQYLDHFAGRPVVFVDVQGPDQSATPDAFDLVRSALGIDRSRAAGETVPARLPGIPEATAVIDFHNDHFIGVRTDDALFRFFGRNAFGAPVAVTVHHFGGADAAALESTWRDWIDGVFARTVDTAVAG